MPMTRPLLALTHQAAQIALAAAVAEADAIGVPQNVCIVDAGGNLLAFLRMDGARFLSIRTAQKKALTAASHGKPSGTANPDLELKLSIAADGRFTNLEGGLPIVIDGILVGGVGVGSGTAAQDVQVAQAALRALGAKVF